MSPKRFLRICYWMVIFVALFHSTAADSEKEEVLSVGKLRNKADTAFSEGNLDHSVHLWNKVVEMEPTNENNFYKRFRVYYRLNKLKEALSDLNTALKLNPQHENSLTQRAKLHMKMGKCNDAFNDFIMLQKVNPKSKDLGSLNNANECAMSTSQAENAIGKQDWPLAIDHLSNALRFAESSIYLLMHRAISRYHLGQFYEAIQDAGKVLKTENDNIDALELRGRCYFHVGEFEAAMNHYRQGLKFDPEHSGCKNAYRELKKIQTLQKNGEKYNNAKKFTEEVKAYEDLLKIVIGHVTLESKTVLDLSNAYIHNKQYKEAKDTIKKITDYDENNHEAFHVLGKIHMELEEYEEAVQRFRKANEIQQSMDYENDLRRADAALKQSKQKDYYKILGISRKANNKQIKKAYRELALQWHPDKHQGEEEKQKAEKQFQLIAEAYEVLSDTESKSKYDRGEDVFPNQGGGQQQQHHNPFGFDPFGGHGGGHHQQFHFRY